MNLDRVLIVGNRGMLARAVGEALAQRGQAPVGVDLPACDITSPDSLRAALQRHRPTVVFNCAAYTRVDACEANEAAATMVNGAGVGYLAQACRETAAKLVHLSTDFVFDGRATRPYRPQDPPAPLSAYGRSKLRGEQLLQQADPPHWLIVRTAWLYGLGGVSFPRTIVERARAGQPLRVVNDQWGSPTCTLDLAQALLELVEKDAAGLFHATNSGQTNWYEFAAATLRAFGLQADLAPTTTEAYLKLRPNQAPRPAFSTLDCTSLHGAIGHPLRAWETALADFAQRAHAGF